MPRPHMLRPQDAAIMRTIVDKGFGGSVMNAARAMGVPHPTVSNILSGRYALLPQIRRIRRALPYINEQFLMTGEGDPGMLSVTQAVEEYGRVIAEKDAEIERLSETVADLKRRIESMTGK